MACRPCVLIPALALVLGACAANPTPHPASGGQTTDEVGDGTQYVDEDPTGAEDPDEPGNDGGEVADAAGPSDGPDVVDAPEDTFKDEEDAGPSEDASAADAAEVEDDAAEVEDDPVDPGPASWLHRAGGHGQDEAHAVAGGPDGSVWAAGFVAELATVGHLGPGCPEPLYNVGGRNAWLARWDADGQLLWARADGGPGRDEAEDVAVASDGEAAYATGTFANEAVFDLGTDAIGAIVQAQGEQAMWVARVGGDGMLDWVRAAEGTGFLWGRAVHGASDGGVFASGSLTGTATFGAGEANETALTAVDPVPASGNWATATDIYLARYAANGELAWARAIGGVGGESAQAMVGLGEGVVLGGSFSGELVLDDGQTLDAPGMTGFLLALDGDGATLWGATQPTASYSVVDRAVETPDGAIVALVRTGSAPTFDPGGPDEWIGPGAGSYLARYTATGGFEWAVEVDEAHGLAVLADGTLVTTGSVDAGDALDAFVALYSADGSFVDSASDGGVGHQVPRDVAVAGDRVAIAGRFNTEITFWGEAEGAIHREALDPNGDAFVASLLDLPLGSGACTEDGCPSDDCQPPAFTCGPSIGWTSLPGVTLSFPDQDCSFTLAEAAAGVSIDWVLTVAADVEDVVSPPADHGHCGIGGAGGLEIRQTIGGGGQSYCICDVGLCFPQDPAPFTLEAGTYEGSFQWDGVNWIGPSDFDNPKGDPFPPGDYTVTLSATGVVGDGPLPAPYSVVGTFGVTLTD